MPFQSLIYDTADAVATITLNRPASLNAIAPPMPDELESAVHAAVAAPDVKVIVLRGAGRAFYYDSLCSICHGLLPFF